MRTASAERAAIGTIGGVSLDSSASVMTDNTSKRFERRLQPRLPVRKADKLSITYLSGSMPASML